MVVGLLALLLGANRPATALQADSATIRVHASDEEAPLPGVRIGYLPVVADLTLRPATDTAIAITLMRAAAEIDDLVVSVTRSTRRVAGRQRCGHLGVGGADA